MALLYKAFWEKINNLELFSNTKNNIIRAVLPPSNNQNLKLVKQVHSNKIIEISKNNFNSELKGDGLITKDFSIALGVLTADCAPIFVFDKKKNFSRRRSV